MNGRGFTLLECLVYIGLLSIVLSGMVTSIWAFAESIDRIRTQAILEREGMFISSIVASELTHSQAVTLPTDALVQVKDFTLSTDLIPNTLFKKVAVHFDITATTSKGATMSETFTRTVFLSI